MAAAWERLERYARWKQRRLRLLSLPDDAIEIIAAQLDATDVGRLVRACTSDDPWTSPHDVPEGLCRPWLVAIALGAIEEHMRGVMFETCFHILRVTGREAMLLTLDWSHFAQTPPTPHLRVHMDQGFPRASVDCAALRKKIEESLRVRSQCCSASLHIEEGDGFREWYRFEYWLVPSTFFCLLRQSCRRGCLVPS